jgi:hypothetical protein
MTHHVIALIWLAAWICPALAATYAGLGWAIARVLWVYGVGDMLTHDL